MAIDRKKLIESIDKIYNQNRDYYKTPYIESKLIEGLTFGQVVKEHPEPTSQMEKILGTAAEFAGMAPGFGVASKIARYGTKLAGLTGAAARIATEAGVGGIIGVVEPAEDERERVAHVLENAAIFGAFGAGAEGLRRIVRKIRGVKDIKSPLADEEIGEIVDEVTRSGDTMERFSSLLPVPIKERFDYWARQRRVLALGPRPQRVIGEDILAGEAGVRQRFGEGLYLPGAAERKALPESLSKTLAGERGVLVRLPGSLKRTALKAGDVVTNVKSKTKHVVKNVGEVIGISEPGTRGTKQIPRRQFERDYVFGGRPEDVRGRVGEREILRTEIEAMPRVSREVTERMPAKDLGPIEEADRFKVWKKKIGKEQLSKSAVKLSSKEKTFFEIELDNLRKGKVEKGGLIRDAEGQVTGRYGSVSTNPDWFRKDIVGNWDKREVVSMMDKAIGGQALTPRQKQMFEDVRESVNRHHEFKPFTGQFAVAPAGFVAGVEKDEEGKWRLNPSKAMAGALGTLALGMALPGTYSKLRKLIVDKMPAKAAVQDVKNIIKKGGIKAEEIEYSGVERWLEKRGKSVGKDDVVRYLDENAVQVREITKGKVPATFEEYVARKERTGLYGGLSEADYKKYMKEFEELSKQGTKFQKYTLPGGENYRELLITLPEAGVTKKSARMDEIEKLIEKATSEQEKQRLRLEYKKLADDLRGQAYQSAHWDEANVLAHVRFNDRVDADGKRVLFIEEIQSDWHQAGRKKGYAVEKPKIVKMKKVGGKYDDERYWLIEDQLGNSYQYDWNLTEKQVREGFDIQQLTIYGTQAGRPPDAPFKKSWPELGLKRMVRYAADNGYDRIAWTTGRQQAERYDLRKQVSHVLYAPKEKELWAVDLEGREILRKKVAEHEIEDYVGKEAAQKILSPDAKKNAYGNVILEGDDLAVGGEGMISFYDKMLPNMMNKIGKKYGARVGETRIKQLISAKTFGESWEKVPFVDITPALKKEAQSKGFPLFSVTGGMAGFEVDEEGNVSYDPTKGLLGLAGGVVVGKAIGAERAKRLIDKIARLGKDGQNFIRKTFDLKFHKMAEMDQAKANALDEVVEGMLKRGAKGVEREAFGVRRSAARGVLDNLKEMIDKKGTDAFRRAMKAARLSGKSLDDLTAKEAEKVEKILAGFPELAKGIKETGKIEAERGSVRAFVKEKFEKARKWMDAAVDTPFDEANLRRYGDTAWNKGQHGIFAREIDERIKKDVRASIKGVTTEKNLKQATADFKAAVTLNLERGINEWNQIYNEAVAKVQDPVTKDFLKRVKGIIDDGGDLLKQYTDLFRKDFARYKEILADEGLKKEFVEDYVTHLWNMKGETLASSHVALKTQFQYAKERLMPSYIQGIAKGLKPLGLDVVYINEHYKKALETVLANRRFVQHLQGLSVEMANMDKFKMVIDSKTFEALPGFEQRLYTTVAHRAFAGKYVHSQVAKDLRNIFETSKWRDVWYGKGYLKLNQYMKRMKLAASGFHHVALGFNNMFYHSDKWWKVGNPLPFDLFNWKSGYKKGMEAYFKKNPILEFGVKNGLTLDETGAMADYYHKFKRNMLSWPEQRGALGEMKQMARDFVHLWDDALWGKFFVGSKGFSFMTEYARNLKFLEKKFPKLYEEWKAKGFAKTFETAYEKKAAQFAARDVNDLYGGLNYELLKISQTTQDTLRAFVLAPDWQTSNWRSFLNGVRNLGTGGSSKTTVAAGKRLAQVVITLGGLGNMINYVTTGRFVWDNPAGYKGMVAIGEVDGKPYYMDFYRHFGEFLKVFKYGNDKKISTYVYDSPIRYLVNKSSQLVRVVDAIRTGEDWRGRPLADWKALMSGKMWQSKYIPWWERGSVLPGVILQIGEAFVPIPGQQVQRSIIGDEPWIVGGTSLFGIHVKEYHGNQAKWKPKTRKKIRAVGKIRGVS